MMNSFFRDVRYSARMLFKNPAFTAVAVVSIALGIGANSLVFSVVTTDAATFALVPLGLVAVVLAACFLPARRASKVNPLIAMRYE